MTPSEVVQEFFESMQRRDWEATTRLVDPTCVVIWPSTGESFTGSAFVEMNRVYPEGWAIEVIDAVGDGSSVAARVRVTQDEEVFWCAGFYTVTQGQITAATEHWSTEGAEEPPTWRAQFSD